MFHFAVTTATHIAAAQLDSESTVPAVCDNTVVLSSLFKIDTLHSSPYPATLPPRMNRGFSLLPKRTACSAHVVSSPHMYNCAVMLTTWRSFPDLGHLLTEA